MSKLTLYNGIKTDLLAITGVSEVKLWNNQLQKEKEEYPILHKSILIEFLPSTYTEYLNKLQKSENTIRLHIIWESYTDDDLDILTFVESVFTKMQHKQYGTYTKLLRIAEDKSNDHDNLQDYTQDYSTSGKEAINTTLVPATLSPEFTVDFVRSLDGLDTEFEQDLTTESLEQLQ